MQRETERSVLLHRWARYHVALRVLSRAAALLRGAGVPVVPVKGIALARWIYADVAERPFKDIDLLVPRPAWDDARRAIRPLGEPLHHSSELGELIVRVDGLELELHAELGRREIVNLSVEEILRRAVVEEGTFGFPVMRLTDVDHLLLVAINALKDGFVFAEAHVPGDLDRLLARVDPADLVRLVDESNFRTGLYCVGEWMYAEKGSAPWGHVLELLGTPPRTGYVRAFRAFRRSPWQTWEMAVALGCWSNDRFGSRLRAVGRLVRRRATRILGGSPP
jgi:hypothetical protein